MRSTTLVLQLAALSTAIVIPDEHVLASVKIESYRHADSVLGRLLTKAELFKKVDKTYDAVYTEVQDVSESLSTAVKDLTAKSRNAFDDAIAYANDASSVATDRIQESFFDAQAWFDAAKMSARHDLHDIDFLGGGDEHPPHHGDGDHHHGDDHRHHRDGDHHRGDGHHGHHGPPPHHGGPHHGGPHHKANATVWQLINSSKYSTKLAKFISGYPDLVKTLNTTHNLTVFAPTDRAFDKIPDHAPKPSKEVLEAILSYHVSPDFYPAGRILVSRTIPTLLNSSHLGAKPLPQRLSTNIGFKGLTINFYSRVVAPNIFGTNGVIHGVDSVIVPPPRILKIVDLLPSEFSTFELALGKTGFIKTLNESKFDGSMCTPVHFCHRTLETNPFTFIATLFAPSNFAFQKLGPRINAFLFSSHGLKYLEAILKYHVVPDQVLYSDAYYTSDRKSDAGAVEDHHDHEHHRPGVPKGLFHADLPTLLDGRSLSVDVARYGRLVEIKVNGFARVDVSDGVARDGVIHVVSNVLIPPKQLPAGESQRQNDGEMSVEELVERLEPYVVEREL